MTNKMQTRRQKGWLLKQLFLCVNLNPDEQDFWWGEEDIWDKNVPVKFRFFKFYLLNVCQIAFGLLILFVSGIIYTALTEHENKIWDIKFLIVFWLFVSFILTFFNTIFDWRDYKKGVYQKQSEESNKSE